MKKQLLLLLLFTFLMLQFSSGQIRCIECYQQNDTVYAGKGNLVLNGGFKKGCPLFATTCPTYNPNTCNIANWKCTGNGGVWTYDSLFTTGFSFIPGTKAAYFANNFCNVCTSQSFDTTCLNSNECTVSGIPEGFPENSENYGGTSGVSLEQTIKRLVKDSTYVLEFWAGGEYDSHFPDNGLFALDIGYGNTFFRNKPTAPQTGVGTRYVIYFTATSSAQTIKFTNWGHICTSCTEFILDDVRLYPWNWQPATPCENTESVSDAETQTTTENLSGNANENDVPTTIAIYPNPSNGKFMVQLNGTENREMKINVSNVLGKTIFQSTWNNNSDIVFGAGAETNQTALDISNQPKGIYFVEVQTENSLQRKRVVKE